MKLRLLVAAALLPFLNFAQLSISPGTLGDVYRIDFDNNLPGVNNGHFEGTGFNPGPATGQLNSNAWRYTSALMTPTGSTFGGTANTGAASRGIDDGITGNASKFSPDHGIYSFKTNNTGTPADYSLGAFIPGPTTITLKAVNNTGSTINVIRLGFDAKYYNSRADGTRIKFGYSSTDLSYTDVGIMESFSTIPTAGGGASWESHNQKATISNLNWASGTEMYFQWTFTKINSAGYSDPAGIDNITLQPFDAKYLFDGNSWVTAAGTPSGSDPGAVAFVLYGGSTAQIPSTTSLGSIIVEPQAKLNIGADLTVSDSAVLEASSNGYSQVIGEIAGPTRWQSYRTTTAGRWFNIAIPVVTTWNNVTGIPVQTVANPNQTNLWYYDAADTSVTLSDGTFKHVTDMSTAPTNGIGYQLYAGDGTYFGSGPFLMEASGSLVDGDVFIDVEGHPSGRFNLIPNPYPSVIQWSDVVSANGDVAPTYYIQDGEPDVAPGVVVYREYTDGGAPGDQKNGGVNEIAPGQAFFVMVDGSDPDGTLDFRNTFRTLTDNPPLFKTTAVPGLIKLKSTEKITGFSDETEIRFDTKYSDNYAFREDGVNMMNTGYPNIYTHADGKDLVFNGMDNSFSNTRDVDLYFQGDNAGNYEMNIAEDGLPAEWTVILEDKMTGSFTNLRKTGYTYSHAIGANNDRFVLHFNKTGAIGLEEQKAAEVYSFVSDNTLTVSLDDMKNADISIYDMAGREVAKLNNLSGKVNVDMSEWARGVYVINVSANGKQVYQNKVVH